MDVLAAKGRQAAVPSLNMQAAQMAMKDVDVDLNYYGQSPQKVSNCAAPEYGVSVRSVHADGYAAVSCADVRNGVQTQPSRQYSDHRTSLLSSKPVLSRAQSAPSGSGLCASRDRRKTKLRRNPYLQPLFPPPYLPPASRACARTTAERGLYPGGRAVHSNGSPATKGSWVPEAVGKDGLRPAKSNSVTDLPSHFLQQSPGKRARLPGQSVRMRCAKTGVPAHAVSFVHLHSHAHHHYNIALEA